MSSLVDEEAEEASQGHESEEEEEEEERFQYSSYGESTDDEEASAASIVQEEDEEKQVMTEGEIESWKKYYDGDGSCMRNYLLYELNSATHNNAPVPGMEPFVDSLSKLALAKDDEPAMANLHGKAYRWMKVASKQLKYKTNLPTTGAATRRTAAEGLASLKPTASLSGTPGNRTPPLPYE